VKNDLTSTALQVVIRVMISKPRIRAALAAICNLNERDRALRAEAVERFIAGAAAVLMIPEGVLLQFGRTGANARAVLDFISSERECCTRYEYRVRSANDMLDLEITGHGPDIHHLQTFYLGLTRRPE
jgi:hypothetical protein